MEWERYQLDNNQDGLEFVFFSEGPKGRISKAIRFQHVPELGKNVFNLAFGEFNKVTGQINDRIISNNGDRQLVLHTVAYAVVQFMNRRPFAIILIKGSTASRVRLYQIGIAAYWPQIKERYEVLGKRNSAWLPFQKGINYEEFLVFKKDE